MEKDEKILRMFQLDKLRRNVNKNTLKITQIY